MKTGRPPKSAKLAAVPVTFLADAERDLTSAINNVQAESVRLDVVGTERSVDCESIRVQLVEQLRRLRLVQEDR